MDPFPVPGRAPAAVAVAAPRPGPLSWSGAPSAALEDGGGIALAYRRRVTEQGLAVTVLARSDDGERFETVAELDKTRFDAHSLERPALVRTETGRWRLYVSCASADWPASKHWWIDVMEADTLEALAEAPARAVLPGDPATLAVKDPVVRRGPGGWTAWVCCHPLDVEGAEDRMTTALATSPDGLDWRWRGTVMAPRPGTWDARGTRVTAVLADGRAAYDGRASAAENFGERTGLATPGPGGVPGSLAQAGDGPVSDARYLDVLALPGHGYRLYYEAPLPDGSHELRTELAGA